MKLAHRDSYNGSFWISEGVKKQSAANPKRLMEIRQGGEKSTNDKAMCYPGK
jgi:hypothetical protein